MKIVKYALSIIAAAGIIMHSCGCAADFLTNCAIWHKNAGSLRVSRKCAVLPIIKYGNL